MNRSLPTMLLQYSEEQLGNVVVCLCFLFFFVGSRLNSVLSRGTHTFYNVCVNASWTALKSERQEKPDKTVRQKRSVYGLETNTKLTRSS